MNLFTFNSKNRYRYYSSVFLFFYVSFAGSFFAFCLYPSRFYWRAWEFFDDIVFQIPSKRIWSGKEFGDQSRQYLLHFQNCKDTIVTCNKDGFRSASLSAKKYPIAVFGDSHVWGSGLADQETIPWLLGEALHIPTFNAGRQPFHILKDLSYPKISQSKIVIEIMAEHLLEDGAYSFEEIKIKPCNKRINEPSYRNCFFIHPKRYFVLLKLYKYLNPIHWINELTHDRCDNYMMIKNQISKMNVSSQYLQQVLHHIKEKSILLKGMGHHYIFALTPSRHLLLAHREDDNNISIEKKIAQFFKENGVCYVDMCEIFRNTPNPKELYQPTDSHISAKGAKIMADALKQYILSLEQTQEICLSELFSKTQVPE